MRDGLHKCQGKLRYYCIKWELEVSIGKPRWRKWYLLNRRTMGIQIKFMESYLENVDPFGYLGFEFKYNTAVSHTIANRAFKARRVTHMIMQALGTHDKNISPRLYDQCREHEISAFIIYYIIKPGTMKGSWFLNCGFEIPFVYASRVSVQNN